MRIQISIALGIWFLILASARAATPVSVTNPSKAGPAIPENFVGLSYETKMMLPVDGKYYFRGDNAALIATFKQLGVRSLRIGGNSADNPAVAIPSEADIDSLFEFAKAADIKVIYTLRLKNTPEPTDAAKTAKYIWSKYRPQVVCFAIGNEPNVYVKTTAEYFALMRKFIAAIDAPDVAPGALFSGPGSTPGKVAWSRDLANEIGPSKKLAMVTQHSYPGGSAEKVKEPTTGRSLMFSDKWIDGYQKFYDSFVPAVQKQGVGYRLEECNSFFYGGAEGVSDAYAASVWALDFMYWWAEHDCDGVNFHTGDSVAVRNTMAAPKYAAFISSEKGYHPHAIAYGLKAFDLGGHGSLVHAAVREEDGSNVTAYAVQDKDHALYVTVINKNENAGATVQISAGNGNPKAQIMLLAAPNGDTAAKEGILLGGGSLDDIGGFDGKWSEIPESGDAVTVELPAASAAIVKLTR